MALVVSAQVNRADDSKLIEPWAAWQPAVFRSVSQPVVWVGLTVARVAATPGVSDLLEFGPAESGVGR